MPKYGDCPLQKRRDVAVTDDDALRLAGRAGREEDVRRVVRGDTALWAHVSDSAARSAAARLTSKRSAPGAESSATTLTLGRPPRISDHLVQQGQSRRGQRYDRRIGRRRRSSPAGVPGLPGRSARRRSPLSAIPALRSPPAETSGRRGTRGRRADSRASSNPCAKRFDCSSSCA